MELEYRSARVPFPFLVNNNARALPEPDRPQRGPPRRPRRGVDGRALHGGTIREGVLLRRQIHLETLQGTSPKSSNNFTNFP